MKYVAVMPWVSEQYKKDCLASCAFDDVMLIDNRTTNLGVSRSWNLGIDKLQSTNADWLIVMSAAVRFGKRSGKDFLECLNRSRNALIVEATHSLYGWHLVAFSRECLHRIGRFDENFFPGYYADLDYSMRFQRYYEQDFRTLPPPTEQWRHIKIDAHDMGMAHGLRIIGEVKNVETQIEYFEKKWGRHPDHAFADAYERPFDNADNPVGYWPPVIIDDVPGRWDTPAIPDYIDADKAVWKKTTVNAVHETSYDFELPWPVCDWENIANWENERFESMRVNLKRGDVFYEVGAECGWCSLIPATYVGGENMVLIEPSKAQWPNIRHTWLRNKMNDPLACYNGFISTELTDHQWTADPRLWPEASYGPLSTHIKFKHLFNDFDETPSIPLDDLAAHIGKPPDAINIDVEGAELEVLQSCEATLSAYHPKVWVSIHPDLMFKWYNTTSEQVLELMRAHGYKEQLLADDHEQHWLFT